MPRWPPSASAPVPWQHHSTLREKMLSKHKMWDVNLQENHKMLVKM